MERRIVAIIRWLERCSKEYSAGTLESALMDVECARADIDRLRDEVWAKLERRHTAKLRMNRTLTLAQAFFWALILVLGTPTPTVLLQVQQAQENPLADFSLETDFTLEMETEKPVISESPDTIPMKTAVALNELGRGLAVPSAPSLPVPEKRAELKTRPSPETREPEKRKPEDSSLRGKIENKSVSAPQKTESREAEKYIPYDRILSLVQTGERALKNTEPAIKVERRR